MRAITIMYDSLNRLFLPNYGDMETIAPNFKRLSDKMVTFDQFYVGSLPCIPARRELHTGSYNFMHRCWGPLEPFDDSAPEILAQNGIYTHLVTDHAHYWQDGGSTFHNRFTTYEMIRGQEGDAWHGKAQGFQHNVDLKRQDAVNREAMPREEDHPHVKTFEAGMKFLKENVDADNWYLQLEYFDPHEPYFVPEKYKQLYEDAPLEFDWPYYGQVQPGDEDKVHQARVNYRAVLSMLDTYLGKLLDFLDAHDMWKDTMVIVNTDHGYMLGEHGYFGKNYMPMYDEIVHTPFFLWEPRTVKAGTRCDTLCQTIDIAPTLLDFFGITPPGTMQGKSMLPVVASGEKIHDYILFGYFGKHVNITDGRYVYMRSGWMKSEGHLNNYTLLPLHMFEMFSLKELKEADRTLSDAFSFTKGAPVMKIPATPESSPQNTCYMYDDHLKYGDLLFDLQTDPREENPIQDPAVESRMVEAMSRLLHSSEAPPELYERIDIQ